MRYEPARWDTRVGSCTPGGRALINWAHRNGFSDKGCFNDRAVRGSGTPSLHREGRAVDLAPGRRTWTDFDQLVHQLVEHHQTLQIQQVIWNRRVWTVGRNWRTYSGSAGPHLDHAHVELTWHGARHLTVELIDATLSTEDDEMPKQVIIRPEDGHPLANNWYLATQGSFFIVHLATHDEVQLHRFLGAETAPDGGPVVLPGYWFDELFVLTGAPHSGGRKGEHPLRVR